MDDDLYPYTARTRIHPDYAPHLPTSELGAEHVVIAGYHAAFATAPAPDTDVAVFPGFDLATARAGTTPVMALIRIEYATQVLTPGPHNTRRIHWEEGIFNAAITGMHWYLTPTVLNRARRCAIAAGWWAAGGRQAVLPRSVTDLVPGVPTVIDIHDHDPHTGNRWAPA